MAHNVEPMDIDNDFDNKENTFHHSNVLPCTEKGYEELDVSELNMKLRYSTTPASSPMSKSYTANCLDNNLESTGESNAFDNMNLSRSFNSMMTKNDICKSFKAQPLQQHLADQSLDNNRNTSVLRPLDVTLTSESNKIIITTAETNNVNDNSSLGSPSSIALTPEATKEILRNDGGSPIMRGLKSVLNMFRSSQSPIPPAECDGNITKRDIHGSGDMDSLNNCVQKPQAALSSTPIAAQKSKERIPSKRNSPHKDGVVFNDDLERDLLWKDETTILFDGETIPIHKLFLQQSKPLHSSETKDFERNIINQDLNENLNETVEFMDVSYNDAAIQDKTITDLHVDPSTKNVAESDGEFVDCETTFTNQSDLFVDHENRSDGNTLSIGSEINKPSQALPILHNITQDLGTELNVDLSGCQSNNNSLTFRNEPLDATISFESVDKLATSATFTTETIDATVVLESDIKLLPSSTFLTVNNEVLEASEPKSDPVEKILICTNGSVTQDAKIDCSANSTKQLNTTVIMDKADSSPMEATFIKEAKHDNIVLNPTERILTSAMLIRTRTDDVQHINETVTFDAIEKCLSGTSIINEDLQDLAAQSNLNEHLIVTRTFDPVEKSITEDDIHNMEDQFKKTNDKVVFNTTVTTNPTGKLPISATCTNDNTKESKVHDVHLDSDECHDSTVTIDSDEILLTQCKANVHINNDLLDKTDIVGQNHKIILSHTFTENKIQDTRDQLGTECSQIPLNSTVAIESADKSMSVTFSNDINQFHSIDDSVKEHLDVPITTDCNKIYSDISCTTTCVDLAVDFTGTSVISTTLCKNTSISHQESECNTPSVQNDDNIHVESTDSPKMTSEVCNPLETIDNSNLGEFEVYNTDKLKMTDPSLDTLGNQDIINFREISMAEPNPDILQPNTSNHTIHNVVANKAHNDNAELLASENMSKDPVETSPASELPGNILLLNEHDTDNELIMEYATTDNESVSIALPDVINVHTSKLRDVSEDDQMQIDATIQVKLTADLINDTLLDNEFLINKVEAAEHVNLIHDLNNVALLDKESVITHIPTVKMEEIMNVLSDVEDSVPTTFENELDEKQLHEQSHTTFAGNLETTENVGNNENYCVLSNNPRLSETLMKPCESILPNNGVDQQFTLTDIVTVNSSPLEKSNNEDININVFGLSETQDLTPVDDNSINFKVNAEQNVLHDVTSPEVAVSNVQLMADVLEHLYEPVSLSNCMIQSPENEICEKVVSLENMQPDHHLHLEGLKDIGENTKHSHAITVTQNNVMSGDDISEEIFVSENNSPYVQILADKESESGFEEDFDNIENPFATKSKVSMTPPASPKIVSKGYNFDFDDIEDPFATKLKIRMSPPLESPKKLYKSTSAKKATSPKAFNKNERKIQSERKKPVNTKNIVSTKLNKMALPGHENSQIQENVIDKLNTNSTNLEVDPKEAVSDAKLKDISIDLNTTDKSELEINIDNMSKSNIGQFEVVHTENKSLTTSSSEQSAYYSAATSSSDSIVTKNVFNVPEINDMNFNPFATKLKMRLSPPPPGVKMTSLNLSTTIHQNELNAITTKDVDINQTSEHQSSIKEKESASNSSNPCSPKIVNEKYLTVEEVHTDNEDTIEGPFLEIEDLVDDKNSDLDNANVEMLQFSELPSQTNEDNELFIDAEAFEFLLNQNKSNVVADSGKESLFLKFDPLFAKRISSDGVVAALSKIQKRQSTPKRIPKSPQRNVNKAQSPVAGPSTLNVTVRQNPSDESVDDASLVTSKPMMVVTPAVNPVVTPRKLTTPTSSNRRSITFTSPAIAVIDRLLSLSANNSLVSNDSTVTEVSREQNEADLALTQLRELLAEKEINVYNLRTESKELRDRLTTLETQMKSLESQSEERLKSVNELTAKLSEKTKINKSMATVVEEYERTIASLIAETEQDKKRHNDERMRLIKERDEQTAHLASMEVSFSDLHSKYEKSKQLIFTCKANEDAYKKSIKEFDENLVKMQNNYELLKQHATSKLNHANQELEKMNRTHEAEVLKLNAMIKRKDLHITSLEETLAQKTKANEELTAICDELINKVG